MGIALGSGVPSQGISNLHVENVRFWYKEYVIYEGPTPPAGAAKGNYTNVFYDFDLGERPYGAWYFNSTNRHVRIWKFGKLVSENWGATASVADGGAITHGLITTPTSVTVTTSISGEFASVTSLGATTFTVAIKKHDGTAGTTQTIYWQAFYDPPNTP
jgi:hypothetical protein